MPCCMSMTSESQPAWAMTSAEKLDGRPSQLLTTARPSAQISRTLFARAIASSKDALLFKPDPASYGGRCQGLPPRSLFLALGPSRYLNRHRRVEGRGIAK